MDSTNPRVTWIESINPPFAADVFEVVSRDGDYAVLRFGAFAGKDVYEVARMIVPAKVAGEIGGSLLSSFGGKP